jgi:hypothetical protein
MQDISHLPRIIQTSDTCKAGKKKKKKRREGPKRNLFLVLDFHEC